MLLNTKRASYLPSDRDLIGQSHAVTARAFFEHCTAHRGTPLLALDTVASDLDLGSVHIKAEWSRNGLSSFKALGGTYAVAQLVASHARAALGGPIQPEDLTSEAVRSVAADMTVVCASAGNHGLAVAAGARALGVRAVIYLSEAVPTEFAVRLREMGASVKRVGATYEESMSAAREDAELECWNLLSDSSWQGYTKTPLTVMRGYTVLLEEAACAMEAGDGPATHVFVQAGVGGLAAACAGYLRDRWGEDFKFIVVEPEGAPCLLESARHGRPVRVTGSATTLGRLDCKEPSLLAVDFLSRLADAFVLISDAQADDAAIQLQRLGAPVSGCGAAGAAGLFAVCGDEMARQSLDLNAKSRVLLIGTEAAEQAVLEPRQ